VTWGSDGNRVDERIGLSYFAVGDRVVASVQVHGYDGTVYQALTPDPAEIGFTWDQNGCDYTVFLDSSISADRVVAYTSDF
jgi:hypothetical protein